jgi:hypothetical protein
MIITTNPEFSQWPQVFGSEQVNYNRLKSLLQNSSEFAGRYKSPAR